MYGGGGLVTKSCLTLSTPWTVAFQSPLPMGFLRQEYWSGVPFPSPGDLLDWEIEPSVEHCRWILYQLSHQGSPNFMYIRSQKRKSCRRNPNLYGHYPVWTDAHTHLVWGPVDELQRFSEEGPGVGSVVLRIWSLKAEARYQLVWTYFSIWTMTILVCIPLLLALSCAWILWLPLRAPLLAQCSSRKPISSWLE